MVPEIPEVPRSKHLIFVILVEILLIIKLNLIIPAMSFVNTKLCGRPPSISQKCYSTSNYHIYWEFIKGSHSIKRQSGCVKVFKDEWAPRTPLQSYWHVFWFEIRLYWNGALLRTLFSSAFDIYIARDILLWLADLLITPLSQTEIYCINKYGIYEVLPALFVSRCS